MSGPGKLNPMQFECVWCGNTEETASFAWPIENEWGDVVCWVNRWMCDPCRAVRPLSWGTLPMQRFRQRYGRPAARLLMGEGRVDWETKSNGTQAV